MKKADLIHHFGSGMKCSFPEQREGLTEWKAEIGDCVHIFVVKLFSRNEVVACLFQQAGAECRGMC